MFTLQQIDDIHDRLGKVDTLPEYMRALKAIGVDECTSYIADGHSEYSGKHDDTLTSPPIHETLVVAETGERDAMLACLEEYNQGKTSYPQMSKGLAKSGVEKWTFDTGKMTMTYYDKAGNEMLTESLL